MTLSLLEQVLVIVYAFVFKPTYMVLCAGVIAWLWREEAGGLVLLRRAMVSFFVGESMCAFNYLLFDNGSDALELLHHVGMIGMGMLLPWALVTLLDNRVVHFSRPDRPCAAVSLCKTCWKKTETHCRARRLGLFAIPAVAFVALLPLTAPLRPLSTTMEVFGETMPYVISETVLLAEFRLYPSLAAGLLVLSWLVLLRGERWMDRARLPFFVGLGFLGFAMFRFVLTTGFYEAPIWNDFWEQATELLSILGVIVLLHTFRGSLGTRAGPLA